MRKNKKIKRKNKIIKRILIALSICMIIVICGILIINSYVKNTVENYILSPEDALELSDVDCILVLGCGVREDGSPSSMLKDRLTRGIELYYGNAAPKLLMSGDHGQTDYNEVGVMKQYAIDANIPSEDIFMDHAGFSTYESMYRAKEIFQAKKVIIVTQEYHLYRAVYIAQELGLDAYGVSSDYRTYAGQTMRDIREIMARAKDFGSTIFIPEPTFLGEAIPISGNGDITNDEIEI